MLILTLIYKDYLHIYLTFFAILFIFLWLTVSIGSWENFDWASLFRDWLIVLYRTSIDSSKDHSLFPCQIDKSNNKWLNLKVIQCFTNFLSTTSSDQKAHFCGTYSFFVELFKFFKESNKDIKGQFHQHFTPSFCVHRSQKRQKDSQLKQLLRFLDLQA